MIACHLANIAFRPKRRVQWDADARAGRRRRGGAAPAAAAVPGAVGAAEDHPRRRRRPRARRAQLQPDARGGGRVRGPFRPCRAPTEAWRARGRIYAEELQCPGPVSSRCVPSRCSPRWRKRVRGPESERHADHARGRAASPRRRRHPAGPRPPRSTRQLHRPGLGPVRHRGRLVCDACRSGTERRQHARGQSSRGGGTHRGPRWESGRRVRTASRGRSARIPSLRPTSPCRTSSAALATATVSA